MKISSDCAFVEIHCRYVVVGSWSLSVRVTRGSQVPAADGKEGDAVGLPIRIQIRKAGTSGLLILEQKHLYLL